MHAGATACIAFNDLIAIGMLARLRERGVRVPEDMSIVGCDDIFGADFCNPPLTTMTSPIERAGGSRSGCCSDGSARSPPRNCPAST